MKGTHNHHHNSAVVSLSHRVDPFHTPVVMVTPLRNSCKENLAPVSGPRDDSRDSGLSVEAKSEDRQVQLLAHSTPSPAPSPYSRPLPFVGHSPVVQSGIHLTVPSTPELVVTKSEQNRVLRVVVTPIKNLITRHTKTSLLRLKLTPNKTAGSTILESPVTPISSCNKRKRKIAEVDPVSVPVLTPTVCNKPEKAGRTRKDSKASKLKQRLSLKSGSKYNLRVRKWICSSLQAETGWA